MRKAFFALAVLFSIAVSAGFAYAQNETTNQTQQPPPDPCAGVACSSPPAASCDGNNLKTYTSPGTCSAGSCSYSSSLTNCPNGCANGQCKANFCDTAACGTSSKACPDGFVATCTKSCDRTTQTCVSCEPSCQGHETTTTQPAQNATTDPCAGVTCNAPPAPGCEGSSVRSYSSPGTCSNGTCSYQSSIVTCPYDCSNGACNPPPNATSTCPTPPIPQCPSDAYPEKKLDSSGCIVEYVCTPRPVNQSTQPVTQQACPAGCECKYENGVIVAKYCISEQRCNYNGICDKDEDSSCRDCIGGECPINQKCPDGSTVNCYRKEFGCSCEPCPIPTQNLPQGCRQEADKDTGFIRVVCDQQHVRCPPVPQDVRIKCVDSGGQPRFGRDPNGCDTFQCDFGGERTNSPVFAAPVKCPSPEEVSRALEKCKEFNLEGVIGFEGGCKIGKCVQERRQECPNPTESEKMAIEEECRKNGLGLVFEFDGRCHQPKCGQRGGCQRDLPKESYDKCAESGGQLVVRRNNDGCVAFSNCLKRGDQTESFVEDVKEVPSATELLAIAFKLEDLKLEFDKLARKTNDLADYYKSTGSSEEKRFRRVSDMFSAAKDKVDEIKTKLRERVNDIAVDDVLEIKQDLRYLKDVMMKDILFVMLGSGDEIEEIKSGTMKECGTDGSCFDRAIRVCQPVTFRPEGRDGPIVELKGLEGDACILYAKLPEGQGPPGGPYDMTCKIQKYSLGVRNPETDIFPYCTGNMVELIKKYGTGPGGKGGAPGVPGKCSGDECRDYCGRGPQEAKECLQYLGDMLPPEAKQGLEALASGRTPSGFGGGFRGEGEFESSFEGEFSGPGGGGGQLCPDGICDDFEQRNPNACPQDCGAGSSGGGGGGFGGSQPQFQPQPVQSPVQPQSVQTTSSRQACSGCLNNGVCDPGECSECADCIRR